MSEGKLVSQEKIDLEVTKIFLKTSSKGMDKKSSVKIRGRQSYKDSNKNSQENDNCGDNSKEDQNQFEKFNSSKQQDISKSLDNSELLNNTHHTLECINLSQRRESISEQDSDNLEQGEAKKYDGSNKDDVTPNGQGIHGKFTLNFFMLQLVNYKYHGGFIILFGLLLSPWITFSKIEPNIILNPMMLRKNFPQVNNEAWLALETGIEEVKSFNKPSVLFYLYTPLSENLINEYIKQISNFATFQLTNDIKSAPIMVKASDLNVPSAKHDYGFIINKYRDALINNSVMIVKNLDELDGFAAQAFHTLCDEVSPLVPKSLFLFTMRVESFAESDFKLVEEVLGAKWGLEDDIFKPLLTRITSIILRID